MPIAAFFVMVTPNSADNFSAISPYRYSDGSAKSCRNRFTIGWVHAVIGSDPSPAFSFCCFHGPEPIRRVNVHAGKRALENDISVGGEFFHAPIADCFVGSPEDCRDGAVAAEGVDDLGGRSVGFHGLGITWKN